MKNNNRILTGVLATVVFASLPAYASVAVLDGQGTTWSGTPTFETVATPSFATEEANFGGATVAAGDGLAQTFSLSTAGILSSIQFGDAGGPVGFTYGIAIYDLGAVQTPSGGASFTPGTSLLSVADAAPTFLTY